MVTIGTKEGIHVTVPVVELLQFISSRFDTEQTWDEAITEYVDTVFESRRSQRNIPVDEQTNQPNESE